MTFGRVMFMTMALGATQAGCSSSCDTFFNYSNRRSTACGTCVSTSCAAEVRAVNDAAASCASQYTAAGNCPTCACLSNAITVSSCRTPFDNLLSCTVSKCDNPCR